MGDTRTKIKIYGANGKFAELEVLVDTGATFTKILKSIVSEIGLEPKYEREAELGDGRTVSRKIAVAEVEMEDEKGSIPVAIGEEGERSILGYTALEILGFKVNPTTGKLGKVKALE